MTKYFSVFITTLAFNLTFSNAFATEESSDIENSKFCFYADKEYSLGSLMIQEELTMLCVRSENGSPAWQEA